MSIVSYYGLFYRMMHHYWLEVAQRSDDDVDFSNVPLSKRVTIEGLQDG